MIEKINLLLKIFHEKKRFDVLLLFMFYEKEICKDKIRFFYISSLPCWKAFDLKIKSSIKKTNAICVDKDKSFIEIFTYNKTW